MPTKKRQRTAVADCGFILLTSLRSFSSFWHGIARKRSLPVLRASVDTKSTKKARIAWRSVVHLGAEIQEDPKRAHAPHGCVQCVRCVRPRSVRAACAKKPANNCRCQINRYLCNRILLKVKTNLSVCGKLRTGAIASGLARREICLKPESCPCLWAGDRLGRKGNSPCKAPKADRRRLYLRPRFLEA